MPVTIDQLTEGYWWFQRGVGSPMVIVHVERGTKGQPAICTFSGYVHQDISNMLEHLITPVAPYREKNTLVVIGWLGNKSAYLNVPREEALARYREHQPEDDLAQQVQEFTFDDQFGAYDVFDPN